MTLDLKMSKWRITHKHVYTSIWNFSSSVQLNFSQVSAAIKRVSAADWLSQIPEKLF